MKKYIKGYTHAGEFHADDVFSVAFIKMINPDLEIERVLSVPSGLDQSKYLIFDIGCNNGYNKYDHHQINKKLRDNDIPYASFGLLWKDFAHELGLSESIINNIDQKLVQAIDACDNGIYSNMISSMISTFNPFWDEDVDNNEQFNKAVEIASTILKRTIDRELSRERAEAKVLEYAKDIKNHVLFLPEYLPINQELFDKLPEVLFYVYPSNRGGYNIQAVSQPTEDDEWAKRAYFPNKWLGNPDKSLGMTFCHPGNFLAAADTKENALNIANIAVNYALKGEI